MALLRPKDVFSNALKNSAAFIVLVHNHPSENIEPSESDVVATRKIARTGKMLGVFLQDHVIIGKDGFRSLRNLGIVPSVRI